MCCRARRCATAAAHIARATAAADWVSSVRAQDSPYEGGMYQGKVRFPDDYPFKPPSIYMLTPSGRFKTDQRLCLSISDFHPETWVPTWSVASILNGVLSFMLETAPTNGSVESTTAEKHRLRDASVEFNAKDTTFRTLFPDLVDGKLFTDPAAPPAAPPAPPTAAPPAEPATAVPDDEAEAVEPGSGKNAAKNKKKKEKEKAKKAAAAAGASGEGEPAEPAVDVE